MSKSQAQIENEQEVRRIMKERGYTPSNSLFDDTKPKEQKTKHGSSFKIFISLFAIIGLSIGGIFVFRNIEEKRLYQLNTCIYQTTESDNETSENDDYYTKKMAKYETQIQCYEKHGGRRKDSRN
ncbi:MAG: hypothetical protein Q4B65_01500 [Candidatus Saccharibacteria bacterium]|nr:hypothetical protein [Candidatus Saccharibacteria bacterium]